MDLKKTAEFIKEQRKQKKLTQKELADKLNVTEKAISKWECGNGFPDTSLILPLCKELDINANELLSGRKLDDEEYKQQAENNLVELKSKHEGLSKFMLTLEYVLGFVILALFLALCIVASYVEMPNWARITLIVFGFVCLLVTTHFLLLIEKNVGFYECQHCHHKHIPTYKQITWSMHYGRTRYMQCPKCGKKSWQKKVLK